MDTSALDRDCAKYGCAKECLDPKLRYFDDCFPGNSRIGDADGIIERKGHILILEWKGYDTPQAFEKTSAAQRIMAEAFTANSDKQQWWFILGDPKLMNPRWVNRIFGGKYDPERWTQIDFETLKQGLKAWYNHADR